MRAVTISIGKWHIILAAGKVTNVQLQAAKPMPQKATLKNFPGVPDGTEVNLRG